MTSRTHDLAAVTLVSYRFLSLPPQGLTWETLLGIGVASIIGALIPDIDNVASLAWKHNLTPWEDDASRDFLGGHRHLSHSLIGGALFVLVIGWLLNLIKLPNINNFLIQQSFALGYLSHLIADTLTIEGVPWLYPIHWHIGFPPFKAFRIKTGGWIEKLVVFPLLLGLTLWIYYNYRVNLIWIFKGI
jgi:inner membrane protein